jgi:hypothetical protein
MATAAQPPALAAQAQEGGSGPNDPEKTFTALVPPKTKITVGVFPNYRYKGKILRFDKAVGRTDANLHMLAQKAMWEVYGRQRGHFGREDMSVGVNEEMGKHVVFKLKGGRGKFCVFPLMDDAGKNLKGMNVWME